MPRARSADSQPTASRCVPLLCGMLPERLHASDIEKRLSARDIAHGRTACRLAALPALRAQDARLRNSHSAIPVWSASRSQPCGLTFRGKTAFFSAHVRPGARCSAPLAFCCFQRQNAQPPHHAGGLPACAPVLKGSRHKKRGMPEGIPQHNPLVRRGSPALASRLALFSLHHNSLFSR